MGFLSRAAWAIHLSSRWFFYRTGCSHPFFQGLYRTDNFCQQLLIKTLINTATYYLLSYKTLRKVYLFNHSNCSYLSLESLFVIEMMTIIYSLKRTVTFSFAAPLLSLAVTHCHLLLLFVTGCHSLSLVITLCHSLSLFVTRCTTRCHSLSFVITRCHSFYHSLLLVVPLVVTCCTTRCNSLSLDVPLVCLFINDQKISRDLKICISVPLIQIKTWLVKKLFMVYTENRNRLPHYILLSHILHMNSKLNFWK